MNQREKKTYLEAIRKRYKKGNREQKTQILEEFCAVCKYNRKYAINLLNAAHRRVKEKKQRGRKRKYASQGLILILKKIWLTSDQMCGKKLAVALKEWVPCYEAAYGELDDILRGQLLSLSSATIDRQLKPFKLKGSGRGLSGTKPGRILKNQIPIKTDHWDVKRPGFFEADTVAHCGNSLAGNFIWSITLTDIFRGWTECRATWNKGAHGVKKNIKDAEKRLPFEILGFDCDNGSEFLNYVLIRYFKNRPKEVQFTRSRPYHKNDNAHVEQKNWTHVRHLFGYDRFDKPKLVLLMNDLYTNEWSWYQNHFCPVMKLVEKKRVNSRYYKKYDNPQTPYRRLLLSKDIKDEVKGELKAQHQQLNPFLLKEIIEKKLKRIFGYAKPNPKPRSKI